MKNVPSLPPPTTGVADRRTANGATGVKPVKPLQKQPLPPPVSQPRHAQPAPPHGPIEKTEKRHAGPYQDGRRTYCRRVAQQPILDVLRSGVDRRRHRQREDDIMDHVDEKA